MKLLVVVEQSQTGFSAYVPDLPGCVATGAARPEVEQLIREAIEFHLEADWDRLVTYYRFPDAHWIHLRTTNVIESPFAAVRLRTTAVKRFVRTERATAIIWRLLQVAERHIRRLNAPDLLPGVYATQQQQEHDRTMKELRRPAA